MKGFHRKFDWFRMNEKSYKRRVGGFFLKALKILFILLLTTFSFRVILKNPQRRSFG